MLPLFQNCLCYLCVFPVTLITLISLGFLTFLQLIANNKVPSTPTTGSLL